MADKDVHKEILKYRRKFFTCQTSEEENKVILLHLAFCDECMEKYEQYAKKNLNISFDVADVYTLLATESKPKFLQVIKPESDVGIDNITQQNKVSHSSDKWTILAEHWDVDRLIFLQIFRELNQTHDTNTDTGSVDYLPFYKYLIKKNAQRVDHLEHCLELECTEVRR